MKLIIILFLSIIIFVSCSNHNLVLDITVDSIEDLNYVNFPKVNEFSVSVKLDEEYTNKLEEITSNNIGEDLTIMLDSQILVKAKIQAAINSGIFQISNFESPEESKKFMINLLKEQYAAKLIEKRVHHSNPNYDKFDSLMISCNMNCINFNFHSAESDLIKLTELTERISDKYSNLLKTQIYFNLRKNNYLQAKQYIEELQAIIEEQNLQGSNFYEKGKLLDILVSIDIGNKRKAKELKENFEKSFDWSNTYEVVSSNLVYYSYICTKFDEYEKAKEKLNQYIELLSKGKQLNDNSLYLLQIMYHYQSGTIEVALELSNSILDLDSKFSKYDTVQSKLWHSIILYKNNKVEKAISYYKLAKTEFNEINNPIGLTLETLLTPYVGVFPNQESYDDLSIIGNLAND